MSKINEILFRKCTVEDVPIIQQLADKIWHQHYPSIISIEQINYMLAKMYSAESLIQQMMEGNEFTLIFTENEAVGFCSISEKEANDFFIHKLYVDVALHRKGLGQALLQHIFTEKKCSKSFRLTVNRQNFKAINFYFKNGFVIENVADFDIGNGYVMNDFILLKQ